MKICICISSKFPNPRLYTCIEQIYKIQINAEKSPEYIYTVHVVDSDSSDCMYYNKIQEDFPNVQLHMIKNKHYEYGAWKYIVDTYDDADVYFCIQDAMSINRYINLNVVNDTTAYTFHNASGYIYHPCIKADGIENLKGCGLNYMPIIDDSFMLAQHNSFIVNKTILKDIFKHLTHPPINKEGSCFYERNFGIYFLDKSIHTINLYEFMDKFSGNRS
jgi:hypothetical protein